MAQSQYRNGRNGRNIRPLRSASLNLRSQGMGTKTQFSGFGFTPTGELRENISLRSDSDMGEPFGLHSPHIRLNACLLALLDTSVQC